MDILGENKTVISRLSVKSGKSDPLLLRMRFERFFGAGNFLPAGLPPKAIICIKKLRDPAPHSLNLYRNDSGYADEWQKKVAGQIEELFRRAVRPISESVPALAESVVFLDKTELLACLANDWCRGILNQNWWWQSLFPNLDRAQTVARIWIESAEYVPTALNILAKKKIAADFVRKLQPEESAELLNRVIETFSLKKIQNALFDPLTAKEKQIFLQIADERKQSLSKKTSFEFPRLSAMRFEEMPETRFLNLTFEQEILLGIGLTLARAPHTARSEKFARQIRESKIETELFQADTFIKSKTIPPQIVKPEILRKETGGKTTRQVEKKSQTDFSKPKAETEKSPEKKPKIVFHDSETFENPAANPPEKKSGFKSEKTAKKTARKIEEIRLEKSKTEIIFNDEKPQAKTKTVQADDEKFSSIISSDKAEETETQEFETIVRTNYGGVLYLLNLGLFLKLYRDFSEPLGDEIDLNIWDFVALSSRKFLGKKIEKDEVWYLLKYLAGREKTENFGDDFNPPDEWRIPTDWLKTFQTEKKWFWSKTKNRLIVRHSEKFNIFDIPIKRNFKNQLENELKNYREYFSEITESKTKKLFKNLSPRERFLENLFEFAECRLRQALNLETRGELTKVLFEKSATVAVSATHFEITFSLSDLPLEVRFSGLDRNPGWIPAAGKYVEFHFV
ncbi:hypothetical protein BH20ACI4_BH20ACI4_12100 [soil metagenome]